MKQKIGALALLVRDYDEAITFYTQTLRFTLLEDTALGDGKRWVLVAPPGAEETRLLLAQADTPAQTEAVGHQTGGRVFLFRRLAKLRVADLLGDRPGDGIAAGDQGAALFDPLPQFVFTGRLYRTVITVGQQHDIVAVELGSMQVACFKQGHGHPVPLIEQVPDLAGIIGRHSVSHQQGYAGLGERAKRGAAQVDPFRNEPSRHGHDR